MTIAILGSKVLVAPNKPPIADGVVLVEGDRIEAVGSRKDVVLPPGAKLLRGENWFVMAGLIDAHQHFGDADPSEPGVDFLAEREREQRGEITPHELMLEATRHAVMQLRDGVTTLRIVGEADYIDFEYRKSFDTGYLPGPRTIIAGPAITPSHGHGKFVSIVADGVEGVRKAVRANLRRGVDLVKLMVTGGGASAPRTCFYSFDEIKAAVEETHNYEKTITAHVIGGIGGRYCIEAGIDAIEHGQELEDLDFELAAKRGVWMVLTNTWLADFKTDKWRHSIETVKDAVQRMRDSGVRIAVGADCYHWDHALVRELEILVECGYKPAEAVSIATQANAELCGVQGSRGTLEPGKLADIIAVEGNPLECISNLRQTRLVMKGGETYSLADWFARVQ